MKEKLKPISQAFAKNAIGLDGIIEALTRTAPVPPGPDPLDDPENTVFVMRDGTKKVLTHIEDPQWDDEDAPNYNKMLLYFDNSETPIDESLYLDVIGLKLGTEFEEYQYNSSGVTIMHPTNADDYPGCDFSGLQWIKFEHIGAANGETWTLGQNIYADGLTALTSIVFPPSADGNLILDNNSSLSVINHPNGQIFANESSYIFNGCNNLTVINLPSSGFVKTNFDTGSSDTYGFPETVESITIPANLTFDFGNYTFAAQKHIYFEGRDMNTVKGLPGYATGGMFGDVSETPSEYGDPNPKMTLHCSDGDIPLYEFIP